MLVRIDEWELEEESLSMEDGFSLRDSKRIQFVQAEAGEAGAGAGEVWSVLGVRGRIQSGQPQRMVWQGVEAASWAGNLGNSDLERDSRIPDGLARKILVQAGTETQTVFLGSYCSL